MNAYLGNPGSNDVLVNSPEFISNQHGFDFSPLTQMSPFNANHLGKGVASAYTQ